MVSLYRSVQVVSSSSEVKIVAQIEQNGPGIHYKNDSVMANKGGGSRRCECLFGQT